MSGKSITKSPALNGACAVVLLGIGILLYVTYRASNYAFLSSRSPDGQVEVSIHVTHPNDESRDIHVSLERQGAAPVELMHATNVSGGGDDEIFWSQDAKHFMVVSGMTVSGTSPPGLELTDGSRRIYLLYDLVEGKAWSNPALDSPPVLENEHLTVEWPTNVDRLLKRPQPGASSTPEVEPVLSPTPTPGKL